MEQFDDMDIEEMVSNPFKNIDLNRKIPPPERKPKQAVERAVEKKWVPPAAPAFSADDNSRIDKNSAGSDRILSLEKNLILSDRKIETLQRIINEQNDRLKNIEDEIDFLRNNLPGAPPVIKESNDVDQLEFADVDDSDEDEDDEAYEG